MTSLGPPTMQRALPSRTAAATVRDTPTLTSATVFAAAAMLVVSGIMVLTDGQPIAALRALGW